MTTKSGCTKCGWPILADTEDWKNPLCHAHWVDIGEPEVEPHDKYSELKEFWVLKENVKNGDVLVGPDKPDYSELFYHTVEKSAYSYAVDQWDYWVEEARKAQAKHERALQALKVASKRSTYEWTDGYDYFPSDHANEGRIALANELLKILGTP